jgi:hypothetical protein
VYVTIKHEASSLGMTLGRTKTAHNSKHDQRIDVQLLRHP